MKQKPDLDLRTKVPESPMRTTSFFDSIRYAFRGLHYAFSSERNLKLYAIIATVCFVVNLIVGVSLPGHIAFFICAAGAISAEIINTVAEHIANYLTTELHESIRLVKDMGAAAVLVWGFVFFPLEGVLIWLALSN